MDQCPAMNRDLLSITSRVPVEGKSSVCLICMKYRFNFLSLSAWVKYYYRILKTHHACTHACTYTHTHIAEPFRLALCDGSVRPTMAARSAADNGRRYFIQIHPREGDPVSRDFVFFSRIKKLLCRTETRTRERMCFQTNEQFETSPETIEQELRPAVC